jgi:multidrug resistance protein
MYILHRPQNTHRQTLLSVSSLHSPPPFARRCFRPHGRIKEVDHYQATRNSTRCRKTAATTKTGPAAKETPEVAYTVFSHRVKIFIIVMSATSGLFSPVSSLIYLPALDVLADFYHVSVGRINLSVTTYMIMQGMWFLVGQCVATWRQCDTETKHYILTIPRTSFADFVPQPLGLAPMFFGDMADQMGRRPVYILTLGIYLVANIALALQSNYAALLVLRALQSTGSSGTIALGNAVMADIATPAERSGYISYVLAGIMVGPAIAPTLGGILTQFLSWRWLFWILAIACGSYLILYTLFMPETCRKVVGNGSIPPPSLNKSLWNLAKKCQANGKKAESAANELVTKRRLPIPNPLMALRIIVEKDVALIMLFTSLMVSGFFMVLVPIPSSFKAIYGFNELQVGLCYM